MSETSPDLTSVFVANREKVRRVLVRFVGESEAEDLTQEVFVRVAKALPGFRGESSVSTWIRQIARGVALDYLRSRRHHQAQRTIPFSPAELDDEGAGPAGPFSAEPQEEAQAPRKLVQTEMGACVREYVTRLAPEHRAIIEMKDLEGLSTVEIAGRLGVSEGNAKIRLHRARKALRGELERGCEFYQSDLGTLACDRKKTAAERAKAVSPKQTISSKEGKPGLRTRRAKGSGSNQQINTLMDSSSNCGCAAPSGSGECGSPVVAFSASAAAYVAIGAAIGANCEPCLRHHVSEALKLGISLQDIASAVALAVKVKETPARAIHKLAEQLTKSECSSRGTSRGDASSTAGACGCSH